MGKDINPTTVEQADANIAKVRQDYPHLSYYQAVLLVVYRANCDVSPLVKNTSGGGKYTEYCRTIGVRG